MFYYISIFTEFAVWIACIAIFLYGGRKGAAIWKKRNEQAVKHYEMELEDIEQFLNENCISQDLHVRLTLRKHEILRILASSYPTTTNHKYDI